jgi:hypothetical protein
MTSKDELIENGNRKFLFLANKGRQSELYKQLDNKTRGY